MNRALESYTGKHISNLDVVSYLCHFAPERSLPRKHYYYDIRMDYLKTLNYVMYRRIHIQEWQSNISFRVLSRIGVYLWPYSFSVISCSSKYEIPEDNVVDDIIVVISELKLKPCAKNTCCILFVFGLAYVGSMQIS